MGNLTTATIFIVMLNVLMWFSTIAMVNVNPDGTFCYNTAGSVIASASTTNYTTIDADVLNQLPETAGASAYTDPFAVIGNWFKSIPGVRYVYGVVAAPYNILKCMNLPIEFVVGVGTLWYLVSLLVLVAFWMGRD